MSTSRSYDDPCGVARALDRVGERWALLVVRELLLGPKRFTDLRAGLPSASPNVLSQRLRELEQTGVVRRRALPPPAPSTVYELTPWGAELGPVVMALGKWGSRAWPPPAGELSVDALMIALQTTFDASLAKNVRARIELRLGAETFRLEVARGALHVARGSWEAPDATVVTDAATLRALVFAKRDLAKAARSGEVEIEGDAALVAEVVGLFPRPVPATVE
jgi:DNA-binding HxlR family transcriptional regulator